MSNNKRIAKNTLLLYFRMLLTMGVTLYTSRVVLDTLGVDDFGIYNVVGGVVVMFGFLNSAMSSATQRFLSFEIGRNDSAELKKVFSLSLTIHALIALIVLVLAETIGLWFLNAKLVIPPDRMMAANWVYQFSLLAFIWNVMSAPYNAAIISHERMGAFAYISIVEVALKLLIVFLLGCFDFDKLKFYAILMFAASFAIRSLYQFYCKRHFVECTFHFFWDKALFLKMSSFVGWNFFGATAGMINNQGITILLNLFFGPITNAARAIAVQLQGALNQFVANYMQAVNPQIVKSYSSGDKKYMNELIFSSSKYSFFLMAIMSMPLLLETDFIIRLWLVDFPVETVLFTKLTILYQLTLTLTYSINMASQASGKVKIFQIVEGCILLFSLPVSYSLLKMDFEGYIVFIVMIILSIIALFSRVIVLRYIINFSIKDYLYQVVSRVVLVSLLFFLLYLFFNLPFLISANFTHCLIKMCLIFFAAISIVFFVGLKSAERYFVIQSIKLFFKKIHLTH